MTGYDVVVVGGGAAGFFAAINICELRPEMKVLILEQSKEVLNKVRISGGGRCNVTHACFDPKELTTYYPRGNRELLGPFYNFGAADTVNWFDQHGVQLKTERDGRMFPATDNSETIIACFKKYTLKYGIEVKLNTKVKDFTYNTANRDRFTIHTDSEIYSSQYLIISTGSSQFIWNMIQAKGFEIITPVPSLFTFNMPGHPLCKLMGVVAPYAKVYIEGTSITSEGPVLVTHWGLSGPAVLKASAWGAVQLAKMKYDFQVLIDWIPAVPDTEITALRNAMAKKKVISNPKFDVPARLWEFLIDTVLNDKDKNWASLSKSELSAIITQLKAYRVHIKGKTTFKEEFVTAGGVALHQINFKTFETKKIAGLYMAGEVLDIDAVTGGFNFQAAWTGGYLVAKDIASAHF
ncbi:MAG: NAD(P)/FAD-dependent oxidoreductase [Saprospiraceae bacterium]|nr:MAG: flavoprotein [Bacteroidetes bacterium OLB9]MCO6462637.1 NAD(P)/FAD-dependent oxidoreductase [Saprospiraceae bacterium]